MFIDTMGEEALSRMEVFYYMEENASRPIDERRRLLKTAQLGSGKINRDRIGRMVESYTGVYPTFKFIHRLEIKAGFDDRYTLVPKDLMKFLRKNIPAHIDFVMIFDIWVIIDSKELEKINVSNLTMRVGIPMWDYVMLDGSWLLDGSVSLNQGRIYMLAPKLNVKFSLAEKESSIEAGAAIHISTEGDEVLDPHSIKMVVGVEEGNLIGTALSLTANIEDGAGAVGETSVAVFSRDYWTLDGTVTLNGSRNLDAIYRKEIIG